MKKLLLSMAFVLGIALSANSAANYVLRESFEGGQLPEGWSQEQVAGQQDWVIESENLAYPAGAADGQYRIALRNTSTQTIGYSTRLITPVMDLSEVYQPILVFSHAQQQRTGDVDVLRVLYRSGVDRDWVELAVFDKKIANWQLDTIQLDAPSSTYQIAFEANDKFGRGIVLDDIRVRQMPTCSTPDNLQIDGLTTTSFRLRWNGSLDTDSFEILLNKTAIEDPNVVDEDNLWKRVYVNPVEEGFIYSTGDILNRNTKYYAYIRALCSGEMSDWAAIEVRTKNIAEVPYYVDFNNWNYLPGTVMPVTNLYWTSGTDIESNASPFINVNEEPGAAATKQKSPTGTHVLVFAGANSTSTAIPAGKYVYGATPEMAVENVKDLIVSFVGTAYCYYENYNSKEWAAGLIVGVMTDPQDIETFVPVDTVWAKGSQVYGYYQIPLSKYEGNGKYVAFLSRFDKGNLFFIDDLSIAMQEDYPILPTFEYSVTDGNTITITPDVHGAASWDLFIAANESEIKLTPNEGKLLFSKTGITSESFTVVEDTIIDQSIQIYVRANNAYSLPERVLMPEKLSAFPRTLTFKKANNKHTIQDLKSNWIYATSTSSVPEGIVWKYDNNKKYANISTLEGSSTTSMAGYSDMTYAYFYNSYKKGEEKENYAAFPAVDDVKKVQLTFYLAATSSTSYPEDIATIAIGVMTDPYDINTFVALDTIVGEKGRYNQYLAKFDNYQGNGKFIALRGIPAPSVELSESTAQMVCYAYFDDVTIDLAAGCKAPMGIQKQVSDTALTLNWEANGAEKWNVKLYSNATEKKVREGVYTYTVEEEDLLDNKDVTSPKYEIKTLKPHTDYFYQVSAFCGEDTLAGAITGITTDCAEKGEALPYFEGFEGYQNVGSQVQKIAHCWTTKFVGYAASSSPTTYSPYISSPTTYGHSGSGYLSFSHSSTSQRAWVGLPKMNVDSVKRLQISFWMKGNGTAYDDKIAVGVLTDPNDTTTFVCVDTVVVKGNTWNEFIVSFSKYEGEGEYICIKKTNSDTHYYYMDDVKVKMLSNCGSKVSGIEATRLDDGTAFKWSAQDVSGYEILIAKEEIEDLENIDASKVLMRKQVETFQDTIRNTEAAFASNTQYYAYVRTYCSESNTGEWSNVVAFKTACLPETPESFGVEDFTSAERFDCWTVGLNKLNGNPSATYARNTNNYLYLYNAKGTATALGQSYAIMPTLNVDSIKDVEITFQCHRGTGTGDGILDIGVCVDKFDSYIKVDSLRPGIVSATGATTGYGFNEALYYTVRFTDYVGDAEGNFGKKIVLLGRGNMNALNYIYIKNLSVRRLAALNEPINVTIPDSTITVGEAVVNWDAQEGATGYEIKYSTAAIDPEQDTVLVAGTKATIKTVVSATNSVKLTELPGLTMYYVYVRSTNAEGNSIWSNMRKFKSSCPVAFTLPYSENFDGYTSGYQYIPDCWERYFTPNSATTVTCCVYSTAKNGSTGNGLYMGSTLKMGPSYMVLPKMNSAVKDLMISFVYKSNAKTATQSSTGGPKRFMAIGVASDVSSQEKLLETVVWMDTIINDDNTNFKDYTFAFNEYAGEGEYIIFCGYGGSNASSATNTTAGGLYIDDLLIEKIPTCFPATAEQKGATTNTLTIAITDNFDQKAWDLAFTAVGKEPEDGIIKTVQLEDTIKGGLFVVDGLAHSTMYDVYVRANCGNGDVSKWSKPASMKTMYLLSLDQSHWDFEYTDDERANYLVISPKATSRSYLTDPQFTEGNTNEAASSSYFPYLYPTSVPTSATAAIYGYKSEFSMRLYSYSTTYPTSWFALPEIDANLDTLQVRFDATSAYISNRSTMALYNTYAKGTYPHSMKVGVMTDPNDWSTFTELSEYVFPEITATTADEDHSHWNHYTLNLFGAALKGKYIAFATDYKATNYAYVDNIVVEAQTGCGAPSGLNVVDSTLTATSAEVVWVSNKLKWNLQVFEQIDDTTTAVIVDSMVTVPAIQYETKVTLENLKSNTTYTLKVKTICGDENESEVAEKVFTTPCAAYTQAESVWNFEDNLYQYGSSASYLIPECWKVAAIDITKATGVAALNTTQSNAPYAIANTTSYLYAQGGIETTDRALRFYTSPSATVAKVAIAQMPKLEKTDHMQLHFWARAGYCSKSTKKVYSATDNYVKKLYFGTMSDVEDYATFIKLDSVEYSKTLATTMLYTDDEDELWEEFLVPLDKFNGAAPVIVLEALNDKATYYFIDNLEVLPDDYCFRPTGLKYDSVYSDRAQISWRAANRTVQVQLAMTEDFGDNSMILDSIVAADINVLNLTNLPTETKLYLRARSICGEQEISDWQNGGSFLTLAKPLFRENFSALTLFPDGWKRYSKRMINVVDTIAGQIGNPISSTVTTNWYRYPSSIGMAAGHLKDNIYSTSHNTWIVSKQIDLTMMTENDLIGLSFDLAMTDGAEHKGAEPDRTTGYDDAFVVAISLDNAATWKSEDLTVWANRPFAVHVDQNTGDTTYVEPKYVYNNISSKFGGERIFIDLSKYAGKIINFAFYGESTVSNADNDVHIDNVQINTYSKNGYEASTCRWEDYADANFEVSVDEYRIGSTTNYEKYIPGNTVGADRFIRMSLSVTEDQRSERDAEICEGETYSNYNFNIVASESGVYQQKLQCANGCDSVSVLNLTVLRKVYVDEFDEICHGKYMEYCDEKHYTTGIYECKYTAANGCDSIVRHHLTVREILKGEETKYLCPGAEIQFDTLTITTPGEYRLVLDADGCDSLATLHVIEATADTVILRAAIISGDTYSKDPWRGLSRAGDYPISQDNIYGCDSTTILHLMVANPNGIIYDTIRLAELPYVLDGEELLGTETEAGTYDKLITLDNVSFTLRITVEGPAQGIVPVMVNSLALTPNPATVGEPVRILGNYNNAAVEVISATGAVVYQAQNLNNPIIIPGMPAAGVYLIRLTEGDKVYQAKLMVK